MPDAERHFGSLYGKYESYLTRERGLAAETRARYLWVVRWFLGMSSGQRCYDLGVLGAERISAFIVAEAWR
jgi:hypothetical protein